MATQINDIARMFKIFSIDGDTIDQKIILSMGTDDISEKLNQISSILNALIKYIHKNTDVLPENKITENQHMFLELFLSELYQNFFPMAHTQAPLRNLKIICDTIPENDANRLRDQYRDFYIRSQEYSDMLKKISQEQRISIENILGDFNNTLDRLNIPIDR